MRALFGVVLVSAVSAATLGAGGSRHPSHRPFLGLWEGVDVNDGSKRTVSITDHDGDGVLELDSRDSYWTPCDGDRGLEHATGEVRRDGVLETTGVVTCFESGNHLMVMQTYELSRREGTLFADPHVASLGADHAPPRERLDVRAPEHLGSRLVQQLLAPDLLEARHQLGGADPPLLGAANVVRRPAPPPSAGWRRIAAGRGSASRAPSHAAP